MKKFLILVFVFFAFTGKTMAFYDEDNFLWAKDPINIWSNKGYISGYPDGSFRGNNNITRAEVITIINKLNNIDEKINKRPAKDVYEGNWFFDDMGKALKAGLISVDYEGNLRPNDFATREEVIVILSKLFNTPS